MEAWNNNKKFYDVLKYDKKILKIMTNQELLDILEIDTKNNKIDWIFKNKIK